MPPEALVEARRAGLRVELWGGRLRVSPRRLLTDDLRARLVAEREAVLDWICREEDGREILAALAARGITVRLGEDGHPRVGPAHLVDEADRVLLAEHRDAVLAALAAPEPDSDAAQEPEPEPWHSPCSVCGSGGSCRSRVPQPDGGWACQEALDRGLIEPGRPSRFRRRT